MSGPSTTLVLEASASTTCIGIENDGVFAIAFLKAETLAAFHDLFCHFYHKTNYLK